jgi:signal transduction histidine kinase
VLLVDRDELHARYLSRRVLGRAPQPLEVTTVANLDDAQSALALQRYDAILLTRWSLPGELPQELQSLRQHVPAAAMLVLDDGPDDAAAVDALQAGAQDYLFKREVTGPALRRAIAMALTRQRKQEVLAQELRRAEAVARELQVALDTARTLFAHTTHDLRAPLTVIREVASQLEDEAAGSSSARHRELLELLVQRVKDLECLVTTAWESCCERGGTILVRRKTVRLIDIARHVAPVLEHMAAQTGVPLDLRNISSTLPPAFCDPDHVARVLINLVCNALQAGQPQGPVVVEAQLGGEHQQLVVTVTDHGQGMPAAQLQALLEGTTRGAPRPEGERWGLGLAICRRLLDANLGRLDATSVPGKGCSFQFTLPLADPRGVIERFVERAAGQASAIVRLKTVELAELSSAPQSTAQEALATGVHDLAWPVGPNAWLVVEQDHVPDAAARHFAGRKSPPQHAFSTLAKGAHAGMVLGEYRLPAERQGLIDAFASAVSEQRVLARVRYFRNLARRVRATNAGLERTAAALPPAPAAPAAHAIQTPHQAKGPVRAMGAGVRPQA